MDRKLFALSTWNLYMVSGTIDRTEYMGKTTRKSVSRLVCANSALEAEEKFIKYHQLQSSPYGTYYAVLEVEVEEIIV